VQAGSSPKGDLDGGLALARRRSGEREVVPAGPRAFRGGSASLGPAHREGGVVRWAVHGEWRWPNRGDTMAAK
jgi:hypothetical protein